MLRRSTMTGPQLFPGQTPQAPVPQAPMGILDRIGQFMQQNPQAISGLAQGLMSPERDKWGRAIPGSGFARGAAAYSQGMQADDRKRTQGAAADFLGLPPALAGNSAIMGAAAKQKFAVPAKPSSFQEKYQEAQRLGMPAREAYMYAAGLDQTVAGKTGPVPPGYRTVIGENGELAMRPIPGSPASQEQQSAQSAVEVGQSGDAMKAGNVLESVRQARDIVKRGGGRAVGTFSRPLAMVSSSDAGQLRSYVKELQSSVALGAMKQLKAASSSGATGFGALNEKELDLLINEIGALDPDTTSPEIFMQTLDRIEKRYETVLQDIANTVTPERMRELGLDALLGGGGQNGQNGQDDPLGIR